MSRKPKPRLNLRPVMAGMQDTTPEDPYSLPLQAAEEGSLLEPPSGRATGKLREPSSHQPDVFVYVGLNGRLFAGRKQFFDGWLVGADELSEEPPLREKLVNNYGTDCVHLLMRLEVEKGVRHGSPHAHRLVRFAGIGLNEVLEDRLNGLRNLGIVDGDEVVVHEQIPPASRG
jgi:hypothetical protein